MEDWAEIRLLHRAEHIAYPGDCPPGAGHRPAAGLPAAAEGSAVGEFEPAIREPLKQTPTIPATAIADRRAAPVRPVVPTGGRQRSTMASRAAHRCWPSSGYSRVITGRMPPSRQTAI
ncbi:hypothetical protein ABZ924_21780 [Streptomyces sp. NPDC046876]|uniref:hypothetical protein n=1 Tax=Streptomyces sp. NPDC046876 TaxID=3155616 RepID=UPI0033D3A20D